MKKITCSNNQLLSRHNYLWQNLRIGFIPLLFVLSFHSISATEIPDDTLQSVLKTGSKEQVIETYEKFVGRFYDSNPKAVLEYAGLLLSYADSLDYLKAKSLAYRHYASAYNVLSDYPQTLKYWKLQLEALQHLDNKKHMAYTYLNIGTTYQSLNHPDSAELNFEKSYALLKDLDDKNGLSHYWSMRGMHLEKNGNLREGINAKYKALKIAEEIPDSAIIASMQSRIGVSHARLGEHEKAIELFEKSLPLLEKQNNISQAFHTWSNLGVAYNSLQQNSKALEAYKKSLSVAGVLDNDYAKAIASMNIAEILLELGRPDSVRQYLLLSDAVFTRLNARHPLCYNYNVTGKYFSEAENPDSAFIYFRKAFELSKILNAPDLHRDAAAHLYSLQKDNGNYKAALTYHETFKQYNDSLLNAENIAELTKMEEQYKYEQEKKQTDLLHKAALDKRHLVIILVSAGLSLALALLIMAIIQYRRKNAAYLTLYNKSMAQIREADLKRAREGLKNGELFDQIEQNMQDEHLYRIKDLSQDMIADKLKTNRTYVSQAIIDHSGKKFREYVKEYRVKEAMEILADPKKSKVYSIDAISEMVGFNSITTFNTAFKQSTGLTPSQFRSRAEESRGE